MLSELWGLRGEKSESEGGISGADGGASAGVLQPGSSSGESIVALLVAMLSSQYRGVSGMGQLGAVVHANSRGVTLSAGRAVPNVMRGGMCPR